MTISELRYISAAEMFDEREMAIIFDDPTNVYFDEYYSLVDKLDKVGDSMSRELINEKYFYLYADNPSSGANRTEEGQQQFSQIRNRIFAFHDVL